MQQPVGSASDPAVLKGEDEFVVLAPHRVVLDLVEVGGLKRDGVLLLRLDDEGVVVEHCDLVFAVVERVGYRRLSRAGEAENGRDEGAPSVEVVSLQPSVAGCVAVASRYAPRQGEGALFQLAEVAHSQDGGAVVERIKEGQPVGVVGRGPVRVGEDEYVAIRQLSGGGIHLSVVVVQVLKVEHPVVDQVLEGLGDHQVRLYHEVPLKADVRLGRVEGPETRSVDRLPEKRRKLYHVHARLPDDLPGRRASADHSAIVHQEDVGPLRNSLLRRAMNGHPRHLDRPGRLFRQLVRLF